MLSMKDPRSSIADGTPRSHFYTYSLFNLAFGEAAVSTTVTTPSGVTTECSTSLRAYGSRFAEGEAGVFMVNTGDTTCRATIAAGGSGGMGMAANGWILRGDDPADPSTNGVEWNGITGTATSSLSNPVDEYYERCVWGGATMRIIHSSAHTQLAWNYTPISPPFSQVCPHCGG